MKTNTPHFLAAPACLLTTALSLFGATALAASYPAAVQLDQPLAYYRFNDSPARPDINANSGSLGAAGNATNLNVHPVTGGLAGDPDTAAYFDSTARAIIPWQAALNPDATESFTIEAWFCATSDKVAGAFVGPAPLMNRYSYSGVNRQGWVYFQRNPDSRGYGNGQTDVGWNFRTYRGAGSSTGINVTSQKPYKLGVWQHVVTVWEAETQTAIMYIDGEEAARNTWTGVGPGYVANTDDHPPEQAVNGPAGLSIGAYNNTEPGNNPFRGGIDEVAFYQKVLNPVQIQAHYANGTNRSRTVSYPDLIKADGPTGYWRLNDPAVDPRVAVNMGLLQSDGIATNTAEAQHPTTGALANSVDGAYAYHWLNGSATTDLPWNASMNPDPTERFTIETWFRPTSDRQNPGASPINNRYVKSGGRTGWVFFQRAPNNTYAGVSGYEGVGWNFRMYNGVNTSGQDVTSNLPYTVGEWQHIVVTWDGVDTATMYVNGEEAASTSGINYAANTFPGADGDPAFASDFAIGSYNNASGLGANPFAGDVDEVAFYPVMLTPLQIKAHYDAGIGFESSDDYANLVLTAPYELALAMDPPVHSQAFQPISYFRLDDRARALFSNQGQTREAADAFGVATADPVAGPQPPTYPGFESTNAAIGTGNKAWLSLNNPPALQLGERASLEAWIKPAGEQTGLARIVSHGPKTLSSYPAVPVRDGAILTSPELYLAIDGPTSTYVFRISDGVVARGVSVEIPNGDLDGGNWIYLVGTYDGANWTIYRNGELLDEPIEDPVDTLAIDVWDWSIGATGEGWADYFLGVIDEVAIYDQALSESQVAAHYAAASGTPPQISISRSGNDTVITWTGGTLQQAGVVTGPFADVLDANSPLILTSPTGNRFYRVRQ